MLHSKCSSGPLVNSASKRYVSFTGEKDDAALLSFCPDEDIFTLDMVNWSDEEPAAWMAMNRAFNEFAARHGARPLLNQTKGLLRAVAKQLWTPAWYALAEERRAVDPAGRFLTPFFRDVLP